MKPLPKHLTPPEAAEAGTIHVLELAETPVVAVEKLRAAVGSGFTTCK